MFRYPGFASHYLFHARVLSEDMQCASADSVPLNNHDLETRNIVRRDLKVCLNNMGFLSFLSVTMPHMERFKTVFSAAQRLTFSGHENGLSNKKN